MPGFGGGGDSTTAVADKVREGSVPQVNVQKAIAPFGEVNKFRTEIEGFGASTLRAKNSPGQIKALNKLKKQIAKLEKRQKKAGKGRASADATSTRQRALPRGFLGDAGVLSGRGGTTSSASARAGARGGGGGSAGLANKIRKLKNKVKSIRSRKELQHKTALDPSDRDALGFGRDIRNNALGFLAEQGSPEDFLVGGFAKRDTNPVFNLLEQLRKEEATRQSSELAHRVGGQQGFGSTVLGAEQAKLDEIGGRLSLENFLTGQNALLQNALTFQGAGQNAINDIFGRQSQISDRGFNLGQLGLAGKQLNLGGLTANADRLSSAQNLNAQLGSNASAQNAQIAAQQQQQRSAGLGGLIKGGLSLLSAPFTGGASLGGLASAGLSAFGGGGGGSPITAAHLGGSNLGLPIGS